MPRAVIIVLDSVGIGGAPDAAAFGDEGANTLGHIAEACAAELANRAGRRAGPLAIPNLMRLGLGQACELATGRAPAGLHIEARPVASYGAATEVSGGKDTPSGHWEIAGVPVPFPWTCFPRSSPCFPPAIIDALIAECALPGILGDCHASGTEILDALGCEHMRTGRPICYTSADSVFQIAAHEETFGLERLYEVCRVARRLLDPMRIGRVIARPFTGQKPGAFRRTGNRRDFSVPPPAPTLLDRATGDGRDVVSVGKTADIFAHRGTGRELKAVGNDALFDRTLEGLAGLANGGLLFSNFIDFDSEYGHRRDVAGYARALERFDSRLPELLEALRHDDAVILTADHGCDPTWHGSDHTRERVPVLVYSPERRPACLGVRQSFSDVAQSAAAHLGLSRFSTGRSF